MADEGAEKRKKKSDKAEAPLDKALVKKYSRGNVSKVKGLQDKKLRGKLKQYEFSHERAVAQAARAEILLTEEPGFLEAEGIEKTYKFKQPDIADSVDIASAQKYFDLKLDAFGPYSMKFTRNGRFLLIGGRRGHLATMDWQSKTLGCEVHVQETVRDVSWLHIETMFAVAQKKYVYIYDNNGIELHCLKNHREANRLEFLPYHFLLASVGNAGVLRYQDTSTGRLVGEVRSKLGRCDTMTHNPYNAVIHLGHHNGTVTLWSPNVKESLVKMLCHRGPVQAMAIDNRGLYMATSGLDGQLKIWDVRTYKQLQAYRTRTPASCLSISQTGLLAAGLGPRIQVWKNAFLEKQELPYMEHVIPSCTVHSMQFCPFEDVLGVGHSKGYTSLLIPGAGEANFDALEANPYQTKKQRQEYEVKALLEKIQPDLITLDPMDILRTGKKTNVEDESGAAERFEPRHRTKGRSSAANRHTRKKKQEQGVRREQIRDDIHEKRKRERNQKKDENRTHDHTTTLDRFKPKCAETEHTKSRTRGPSV